MTMVKSLREAAIISSLHGDLVVSPRRLELAWKIDLSKLLIWMLECNVLLEPIPRLASIGSIKTASERLSLSRKLSRSAKWRSVNVRISPSN